MTPVNSFERFTTALERKQADRVPVVEWAISPKVYRAICPQAREQSDFEEAMDFDGVSTAFQFDKVREFGDGSYMDEWGVIFKPSPETVDHPLRGPIQTKDDLKKYMPPIPMPRNAWGSCRSWWRASKGEERSSSGTGRRSCGRCSCAVLRTS